ncbi:Nramp family divalent metal transporter [Roseimaritima ulvae]|uniref:Divalent metal cation transporter MntH n=1 Tax=Roseimaritima ulvae TaxID=980254 RepID=A0A5B9QMN6_9BACT|nr:Nramp family divalent metal transporter [Roseimaritima ulvae]QEG38745.1 Divalent metal cation transporter MntH [Roseimaritima ulvae]
MKSKRLGPGLLIAAAFIGPGTVTTACIAGGEFGLSLLWVIVIVTLATILLQEMAARLGVLTGQGLGENLRRQFSSPAVRWAIAALIAIAIGFGNAAYQTGNLIGAALGLEAMLPIGLTTWVLCIAAIASLLLASGSYRMIENGLIGLVALLGLTFLLAAVVSLWHRPIAWSDTLPNIPSGSLVTILALLGTTIVPYNLFLHASAAGHRWSKHRPRGEGIRLARRDTIISLSIGGMITAAILVTAATMQGSPPEKVADMAASLQGALGSSLAYGLFFAGLAAAGLTSAVTAPLAAAYAISGAMGWSTDEKQWSFRAIWITIMAFGTLLAVTLGHQPLQTLLVAQAANALVLPVIVAFLLMACNAKLLGQYRNATWLNVCGGVVLLVVTGLSLWKLYEAAAG